MTPERWRQIEELYHTARERGRAVLADADPELRREVENLLSQDSEGKILDRPAVELLEESTITQLAGQTVFHYKILEMLGAGGMGVVYKAFDTKLDRLVALKFLPPHMRHNEELKRRLTEEARAASALDSPNIVVIYDIDETPGGDLFIAMAFHEGATLRDKIGRDRIGQGKISAALPVAEALQIAWQIAAGLAKAHERGIFHRDIKPANVIVAKDGVARIIDFGLAKSSEATATLDGSTKGTPLYMSPEQASGKALDFRTDLWSLGAVLYEMLVGRPPFSGDTHLQIMHAIVHHPAPRLREARPDLPPEIDRIVLRSLEKDPAKRYQSAADMARDLSTALTALEVSARKPGTTTDNAKRWKVIVPAAAAVLAFFIAGYLYFHRALFGQPKLTDRDTIVLADFTNTTGDAVFDGTLRQGLAIQLEQSPFLKIMDDEQVQNDLRLMSLPPGGPITNQIAHDICVRDGAAATIDGSIASLGKNYVITLQAIRCPAGATLAREQVQAEDKERVLAAVGKAATAMRAKLGESLSSIQKLNRPLEQATTPSLEALQNYTAGRSEMGRGQFLASVPLFERATALDPNFAMAYFFLGVAFNNAGDIERSWEYTQKAFGLIDRVSEYERDTIAAEHYSHDDQSDKAIDAYRLGIRDYPRAWEFHNNLSVVYIDQGQFEEGLKEGQEATGLQANVEPPYRRQLDAFMCLDRLPEAKGLAEKLRAQGLGGARIHQRFLEIAYIDGDQAAAAREIQWFAGKPVEYLSFGLQAANRNALGQRRESSKLYQRAAETALRHGLRNAAVEFEEADARADTLSGNCQTARRLGRPALALAMCGDAAQAEKLAGETSKLFPNGTIWNAIQLPEIRAAVALKLDQPAKAVELLASASPYERAYPEAVYLRGLAYLRLRKGVEAAAEFQKIVDHKGASWGSTWLHPNWGLYYSLSYLGLARASALAGDTAKAAKTFRDFFALWKDADPDIPILIQAKTEYAKQPAADATKLGIAGGKK